MEPPGGWVYRDPDTNMWLASNKNIDDLISQARAHRHANKLAIPEDFSERVEAFIAYAVPPELALDIPSNRVASSVTLQIFSVNKFTNAWLLKWQKHGFRKCHQDEAEQRAQTCQTCMMNRRELCLSCKGIDIWVNSWTGRHTKCDPMLGVCAIDGIVIFASVHALPGNGLEFYTRDAPPNCWKLSQGEQS